MYSAARATRDRLVIVLFCPLFNNYDGISHIDHWDDVQKLLTFVYVQATKVAQDMDKILMQVDVLLKGTDDNLSSDLGTAFDVVHRVSGDIIPVQLAPSIESLPQTYLSRGAQADYPSLSLSDSTSANPSLYPVVALGGTFDHLHAGHKILLSMAAWIASTKVIVGVTDDALLTKKVNRHVMEDLSTRISRVRSFLQLFRPGLVYDIVPINDVYGPTGWDADIQALVVSKETLSGANSIASHRASHSLPALRTFVIDVISSESSSLDSEDAEKLKQTKMSSTFIREWIVAKKHKEKDS